MKNVIYGFIAFLLGVLIALLFYIIIYSNIFTQKIEIPKNNSIPSVNSTVVQFSMADAFAKASPSVGTIYSSSDNGKQNVGSGTVISSDGYVITNYHAIKDTKQSILLLDNKTYQLNLIGSDSLTDIALFKINSNEQSFKYIERNTIVLHVGDPVLAIGNPYNVGKSASFGIISALSRQNVGQIGYQNFVQTDAVLNYGNSGGALVNYLGQFIGMNTLSIADFGDKNVLGLSFALTADSIYKVVAKIKEYGYVPRGYFGATSVLGEGTIIVDNQSQMYTEVTNIEPNSPAAKAGLLVGDKIISFNGIKMINPVEIVNFISNSEPKTKIIVKINRNGKIINLTAILDEKTK